MQQVLSSGKLLVGSGKLIDPSKVTRVFVSPRKRAQTTFDLLFGKGDGCIIDSSKITVTEEIAEWNYGEYEGLLTPEIVARRSAQGMDRDKPWDIWRDGCEGGE
jgi:broad specificity phosphatase PhoE